MNPVAFLKEVRGELGKVVWPTRQKALELTMLVIVVSILVAVYVGGLDFIFTGVMNNLVR